MKKISLIWKNGKQSGKILIKNGELLRISLDSTVLKGNVYDFFADGKKRLRIDVENKKKNGSHGTIVNVVAQENPFSFFVEHVCTEFPIFIPEYGIIVTETQDQRTYDEIERDIRKKAGLSKLKEMENSPEETYELVEAKARKLRGNTWLGISRDIRIFEVVFPDPDRTTLNIIPKYHGFGVTVPEFENLDENMKKWLGNEISYSVNFGRGSGCSQELERYLEDRRLPILCGKLEDEGIVYDFVMFVSLEKTRLSMKNLRGTHFLVADGFGAGHMFTAKQQDEFDRLKDSEINREEETVLFLKIKATNTKNFPAYAYFKTVAPNIPYVFENGMSCFSTDKVFAVSLLEGRLLEQEEFTSFLLPGQSAELEIRIPHKPISQKRAKKLLEKSFEEKLIECRKFWREKLESCARIEIPEKRIEDMIYAGILHLDLIAYGIEPDGPVSACIGRYCPIGSESSPIIQFFDTMAWHKLAERALQYFIEKQHEDGFMQNFGGYMLETGAALWCMGEHFRYTKDTKWVKKIRNSILKAVDYLSKWIEKNKRDEFTGKGYGMIDGKVADPEDPYHAFMLNGYAYLGLQRSSEMLEAIGDSASKEIRKMAEELKENIRKSFFSAMARSPVVPLGDGTWVPSCPPWPEDDGLLVHYINGGRWYTHGTFVARDSMLGPLYLIFQEVLEPKEQASDFLVRYHTEIFYKRNVAFSQPYYSRHPEIHLRRGEINSFLKAYYNCFPALIDRQTGSFWEHFFYASPHKTHEEAWFLMETRWMLCMEDEDTLYLLPGIPRRWLEDGKKIVIENLATYFGRLSLFVLSDLKNDRIIAGVFCEGKPKIVLRIPHPEKRIPKRIIGAKCFFENETITIEKPGGKIEIGLNY
ncbi:MAG: hypothetical protein NC913_09830 [Candidatus Omnitrophica bacterium]|nr:hypothetical protein [Candidatus Omnitrophota bacterium]